MIKTLKNTFLGLAITALSLLPASMQADFFCFEKACKKRERQTG